MQENQADSGFSSLTQVSVMRLSKSSPKRAILCMMDGKICRAWYNISDVNDNSNYAIDGFLPIPNTCIKRVYNYGMIMGYNHRAGLDGLEKGYESYLHVFHGAFQHGRFFVCANAASDVHQVLLHNFQLLAHALLEFCHTCVRLFNGHCFFDNTHQFHEVRGERFVVLMASRRNQFNDEIQVREIRLTVVAPCSPCATA